MNAHADAATRIDAITLEVVRNKLEGIANEMQATLLFSAFSPIVAPTRVPWGEKAFTAYLGEDRQTWKAWDATALVAAAPERLPLL